MNEVKPSTRAASRSPEETPGGLSARHSRPVESPRRVSSVRSGLGSESRRWLGVCLTLARRINLDPLPIRLGFVLLGLLTGPIALLVYLGIYSQLYLTNQDARVPRIDGFRIVKVAGGLLFTAIALYAGTRVLLEAATRGYVTLQNESLDLGEWAWLEPRQWGMFLLALFLTMPLGILASLPMPNRWDKTLKTIAQAILAVYAAVLSLGIASVIVGIILNAVASFFA